MPRFRQAGTKVNENCGEKGPKMAYDTTRAGLVHITYVYSFELVEFQA